MSLYANSCGRARRRKIEDKWAIIQTDQRGQCISCGGDISSGGAYQHSRVTYEYEDKPQYLCRKCLYRKEVYSNEGVIKKSKREVIHQQQGGKCPFCQVDIVKGHMDLKSRAYHAEGIGTLYACGACTRLRIRGITRATKATKSEIIRNQQAGRCAVCATDVTLESQYNKTRVYDGAGTERRYSCAACFRWREKHGTSQRIPRKRHLVIRELRGGQCSGCKTDISAGRAYIRARPRRVSDGGHRYFCPPCARRRGFAVLKVTKKQLVIRKGQRGSCHNCGDDISVGPRFVTAKPVDDENGGKRYLCNKCAQWRCNHGTDRNVTLKKSYIILNFQGGACSNCRTDISSGLAYVRSTPACGEGFGTIYVCGACSGWKREKGSERPIKTGRWTQACNVEPISAEAGCTPDRPKSSRTQDKTCTFEERGRHVRRRKQELIKLTQGGRCFNCGTDLLSTMALESARPRGQGEARRYYCSACTGHLRRKTTNRKRNIIQSDQGGRCRNCAKDISGGQEYLRANPSRQGTGWSYLCGACYSWSRKWGGHRVTSESKQAIIEGKQVGKCFACEKDISMIKPSASNTAKAVCSAENSRVYVCLGCAQRFKKAEDHKQTTLTT